MRFLPFIFIHSVFYWKSAVSFVKYSNHEQKLWQFTLVLGACEYLESIMCFIGHVSHITPEAFKRSSNFLLFLP